LSDAAYRGEHVRLDLLRFAAGTSAAVEAPESEEAVLVLLEGSVTFDGDIAYRKSVFDTRATAVYLPPRAHVMVETSSDAELVLATTVDCALDMTSDHPTLVEPDQIVVHDRGQPGWQRAVHDVVADNVAAAQRLIVGETFNEPGQWSSFPPHKHDGGDGEPALEEVYYFRFDNPDGFGFQGLYESDGPERAEFLRHGSVVGIPHGYHPVCAAPGYRLYYLWALVGAERQLAMYEDPAHRWLRD